jgi:excisionase family DNA binding protein
VLIHEKPETLLGEMMLTKTKGGRAEPSAQNLLKLLTLKEAAAYARVSVSTVRRWVRDEGLSFYKAGRQKRIDETELVRFLSGAECSLERLAT